MEIITATTFKSTWKLDTVRRSVSHRIYSLKPELTLSTDPSLFG